jgi:hypothetical protein
VVTFLAYIGATTHHILKVLNHDKHFSPAEVAMVVPGVLCISPNGRRGHRELADFSEGTSRPRPAQYGPHWPLEAALEGRAGPERPPGQGGAVFRLGSVARPRRFWWSGSKGGTAACTHACSAQPAGPKPQSLLSFGHELMVAR